MHDFNTEHKLVLGLKNGDADSFNQIFSHYGKKLYFFAYGYLKSREESEEVVQEVFLKVWRSRKLINQDFSFRAYLFKIAYNHIRDLFLKMSREQAYRHEIVSSSVSYSGETEERIIYHSLLEETEKIISRLPQRQREILLYRRKEGRSVKEIAEMMGISPKTVENHLTEALKRLKESMSDKKLPGIMFFSLFLSREK